MHQKSTCEVVEVKPDHIQLESNKSESESVESEENQDEEYATGDEMRLGGS